MMKITSIAVMLADESGSEVVEYALVTAVFAVGVALGLLVLLNDTGTLANTNETKFSNGMMSPP